MITTRQPPTIFFVILAVLGVICIIGGVRRWPFLLESGRLPQLLRNFFSLSSEEINDYVAAFYIVGGVIAIITGVGGLLLYFTSR